MRWKLLIGSVLMVLALSACAQAMASSDVDATPPTATNETMMDTDVPTSSEDDEGDQAVDASPTADPGVLLPKEPAPTGAEREFKTDFSKHSVPYSEILSGGPPKDGIPAIDTPQFISVAEADAWLGVQEPVVFLHLGDDVRAYPIQILMWHEIVNDVVDGTPVAVTFCPLCNTAIAFEARIDDLALDFGTTGRLRYSNLVMYDRQTETWWQQATGEAIAGEYTGRRLNTLPATLIGWEQFKTAYPDGKVLSRETGHFRDYGRNPYTGYDRIDNSPFLYDGPETPDALPPMARVLTVELNDETAAYPYDVMTAQRVANDTVGGEAIVVFWAPGTASALDSGQIANGRDVGTVVAFSRILNGQPLTFRYENDSIVDAETGSTWDAMGHAISGALEGQQLMSVVGINHFWFSWAAFRPETRIYQAETSEDVTP